MATNIQYNADSLIQGSYIQEIVLYPKSGFYISTEDKNEVWGRSKILSTANEILFIDYQDVEIPVGSYIEEAKLQFYIADYYGTSDSVTLNVYAAATVVDENTTWNEVSYDGSARGSLISSTEIVAADKNTYFTIDIKDYVSDYIYGVSTARGLILELTSVVGTVFLKLVGLYSWDEQCGEKQNPVLDIIYSYVPSAYLDTVQSSAAITENAFISAAEPCTVFDETILRCEVAEVGGDTKNILLKFDLSDIPRESDILRALIYIPRNSSDNGREHREVLRMIYQDWDEEYVSWEMADNGIAWAASGGDYDTTNTYDSYNFIVEPDLYTYDVTKIMQVASESFALTLSRDFYGFLIKGQDLLFDDRSVDATGEITVEFLAASLNQPPENPTLLTPINATYLASQPEFIAIINKDNAYGATEGNDLDFRLEIDNSDEFASPTSFSTSISTAGWRWSALGDFSDDSTTFPILAGSYTPGTSQIKFVMSETDSFLTEQLWYWRIIALDIA